MKPLLSLGPGGGFSGRTSPAKSVTAPAGAPAKGDAKFSASERAFHCATV